MAENVIRVRRIAAFAIISATIFTGTYAAMRVAEVTATIATHWWNLAAKFAESRRMNIYAMKSLRVVTKVFFCIAVPRFYTRITEAIAVPTGLDALVVSTDEEPWRSGKFTYRVTVEKKSEHPSSYGFLTLPHR